MSAREYRLAHKEQIRVARARWYAGHREAALAYARTYNATHRGAVLARHRANNLRALYGLTVEARQSMSDAQGGLCAICRVGWATEVDHDHQTGVVRGLLCHHCNVGIGHFFEQPSTMRAAVAYIS